MDSLEVILQVSNKILNFWYFFRFLCLCMLTLLMQKKDFGRTSKLQHAKMHVLGNQKSGFFKVWDTLTMIQLRKKKHLTSMSKIRPPLRSQYSSKIWGGGLILGFQKCLRNRFLTLGIENYDQNGHFLFENLFMFFSIFLWKNERGLLFRGVLILDIEVWVLFLSVQN